MKKIETRKNILKQASKIQDSLSKLAINNKSFKAVGIEFLNARRLLFSNWNVNWETMEESKNRIKVKPQGVVIPIIL